jgi:hypothetical protein
LQGKEFSSIQPSIVDARKTVHRKDLSRHALTASFRPQRMYPNSVDPPCPPTVAQARRRRYRLADSFSPTDHGHVCPRQEQDFHHRGSWGHRTLDRPLSGQIRYVPQPAQPPGPLKADHSSFTPGYTNVTVFDTVFDYQQYQYSGYDTREGCDGASSDAIKSSGAVVPSSGPSKLRWANQPFPLGCTRPRTGQISSTRRYFLRDGRSERTGMISSSCPDPALLDNC